MSSVTGFRLGLWLHDVIGELGSGVISSFDAREIGRSRMGRIQRRVALQTDQGYLRRLRHGLAVDRRYRFDEAESANESEISRIKGCMLKTSCMSLNDDIVVVR